MGLVIHEIYGSATPELGERLARFERQFTYPLGKEAAFHVAHGNDYTRFFRAIGTALGLVAELDGVIIATVVVTIRDIGFPDGSIKRVAYVADLKVAPSARISRAFLTLALRAFAWGRAQVDAVFAVVMDGTPATPESYTGRLGLPRLGKTAELAVIRIPTATCTPREDAPEVLAPTDASALYTDLSANRFSCPLHQPELRAQWPQTWLATGAGDACGFLEDTLDAKNLVQDSGVLMRSAHLSCFAYRTPAAGAAVVSHALAICRSRELPALFLSVSAVDAAELLNAVSTIAGIVKGGMTLATASVYSAGLPVAQWNFNTADI